ncbi:MAG: diguanylate cyclase [Acidimicrobiia bacterium]|nr:diguanylate cyclase [Acidimicrobiia bacterium]
MSAAALLAHVTDLVAVVDARGEIIAVSQSVSSRLGHRPEQLVGAPVSRLFVADHAEVPAEVLDRVFLEPGAHGPIQLLAVAADGHVRRVEATIDNHLEGIVDLTGNASSGAVVVTAVDLTERQMVDASLAEQRSLLESIARGANLGDIALGLVERLERWIPDAAALVLVPGPDGSLSAVASAGVPEGFAAAIDRSGPDSPILAALAGRPDEVSMASPRDARWFPVRAACRSAGIEALWVRPLRPPDGDEPIGAVLVVRSDLRAPTELELDLLEQSAHLAAISIERETALAALQHAAVHDELTGLPNRTLLLDRIGQALARASRTQQKVGVLFVDLDRFKHINDTLGHATGDAVLRAVAERLQGVLRSGDTVGRLGGDEFLMVCTEIDGDADALAVGQRVADALVEPVRCGGASLRIRASIGVAVADDGADEPENVIRDADHAMYRAKDRGRDGVVLFERADHLWVLTRVDIEQALHGA